MSTLEKRVSDLERAEGVDAPRIVVNWEPEPGPVEPGTAVVEWDEGAMASRGGGNDGADEKD